MKQLDCGIPGKHHIDSSRSGPPHHCTGSPPVHICGSQHMSSHQGYHWVDSWRMGRPTRSLLPAELATDRARDACRYNEYLRYDDTGKASLRRERGRFEESKSSQHTNPHRDSRTKNRKHGKMHPLPLTFSWLSPTEERRHFRLGGTDTYRNKGSVQNQTSCHTK